MAPADAMLTRRTHAPLAQNLPFPSLLAWTITTRPNSPVSFASPGCTASGELSYLRAHTRYQTSPGLEEPGDEVGVMAGSV